MRCSSLFYCRGAVLACDCLVLSPLLQGWCHSTSQQDCTWQGNDIGSCRSHLVESSRSQLGACSSGLAAL